MRNKEKISNVSYKVISNFWAKLEQVSFDFKFKSGKIKRLIHEVYGKSDGVAVLLYNLTTKKVLLSKQFRIPIYVAGVNNGCSIEVCGGAIDQNESAEAAVIRETKEEMGYAISELKKVSAAFLSPGLMKEQTHLFIANYNDDSKIGNGGGLASENEEIEVLEIPLQDALKLIETGQIIDARTILLLQYLQIHTVLKE